MNKKIYKIIILISFIFIYAGCSSALIKPEAVMYIGSVNNDQPLLVDKASPVENIALNIYSTNGVGVSFVAYTVDYFYSGNIPVVNAGIEKNGSMTLFVEGEGSKIYNVNVVSQDVVDFVNQNPDTEDDNINNLLIKVTLIGVDENDNQITLTGNVEAVFE